MTEQGANARVAALVAACEETGWSWELRDCVVATDAPLRCTSMFDHDQDHRYGRTLTEWRQQYD